MITDQMNYRKESVNESPLGRDTDSLLTAIGIFWIQDKGNFVATQFQPVDKNAIGNAFDSPNKASAVEPELVKAFKSMQVGDAIAIPEVAKNQERSLKIRVNKAGKEADRKLEWGKLNGNHIVRVAEVLTATQNGTAPAPTPAPATATAEKK